MSIHALHLQDGSSGDDTLKCVAAAEDDTVVLAGYTEGSLGGENAGETDCAVVKLDVDGGVLWRWQVQQSAAPRRFHARARPPRCLPCVPSRHTTHPTLGYARFPCGVKPSETVVSPNKNAVSAGMETHLELYLLDRYLRKTTPFLSRIGRHGRFRRLFRGGGGGGRVHRPRGIYRGELGRE